MISTYRKLNEILLPRERRLALYVFILLIFVAVFEAVGVASIMPFMTVLANREMVQENEILATTYDVLGFESTNAFLIFLGFAFLVLIVGSLVFRAFAFWVQVRFSQKRNHAWGSRLVQTYLNRPYAWYLNQHSGNLGASILNEVNSVVEGALFPAMQLVSQALVVLLLIGLLVTTDPLLATSAAILVVGAYVGLFMAARHVLTRIGRRIQTTNRERYRSIQEMFAGVKDVKVYRLEEPFLRRFQRPSLAYAQQQVGARVFKEVPSFAIQALTYGGMVAVLLYFVYTRGGLGSALPALSLFALAVYRLMPALQTIYRNISSMRTSDAVLNSLHAELKSGLESGVVSGKRTEPERLALNDRLELQHICYRYPGADSAALDDICISIPAYTTVGIVGSTGSGKTTLVDVILTLLEPQSGEILVDGNRIGPENREAWLSDIGYVPQQIFLADDTIAANVAFGVPADQIDLTAVENAARIADIHDFVTTQLADGYLTEIGERGVRLSGGQRQRLGIARAVYHDPGVLILDEATSALDNVTEDAVMDAVHRLGRRKTIILIAHRLSTVQKCDEIFYLEKGRVSGKGSFDKLVEQHAGFRRLATVNR